MIRSNLCFATTVFSIMEEKPKLIEYDKKLSAHSSVYNLSQHFPKIPILVQ